MTIALLVCAVLSGPPIITVADQPISAQPMRVVSVDAIFVSMRGGAPVPISRPTLEFWQLETHAGTGVLAIDDAGRASARVDRPDGGRDDVRGQLHNGHLSLTVQSPSRRIVPMEAPVLCGVEPSRRPPHSNPERSAGTNAAGPRVARIAIDADQAYIDRYNGDESAAADGIVAVIAEVSAIYQRDLGIRLELAFVRLWPDGDEPWDVTTLGTFKDWWINNEDHESFNLIHLLSGRRDTPFGGIAYLATACNQGAFGISAFQLGGFPPQPGPPSLDIWDINVIAHELGHNLGTYHTHDGYDPTIDDCGLGTAAPRGTIMSYCHAHQGGLLNIDLRMHSRVQDVLVALNPAGDCLPHDCNENGIADAVDIADSSSLDVDGDGIPDECRDCNGNGVLDPIDITSSTSFDIDGDLIPDECMPDCNGNSIPDGWDVDALGAADANGNRVPDECEADCDGNGIIDFADIAADALLDVDRDGLLDSCTDCGSIGGPEWLASGGTDNFVVAGNGSVREYHARSGVLLGIYNGLIAEPVALAIVNTNPPDGGDPSMVRGTVIIAQVDGALSTVAPGSMSATILAHDATLVEPRGLVVTSDRRLLVSDFGGNTVRAFDLDTMEDLGAFIGSGLGGVTEPRKMTIDGDRLLVACNSNQIRAFDVHTGTSLGTLVSNLSIFGVDGVAVATNGDVLASSPERQVVWRFDGQNGDELGSFTDEYGVSLPTDITLINPDRILVVKANSPARIVEYDAQGRYRRSMIRGDVDLTTPLDVAIKVASDLDCNGNGRPDDCDLADGGDANGDGILDDCQCLGDINNDGQAGVDDLLALIGSWGDAGGPADLNGSGVVDADDLLLLLQFWETC
jgi:hypothetical protein